MASETYDGISLELIGTLAQAELALPLAELKEAAAMVERNKFLTKITRPRIAEQRTVPEVARQGNANLHASLILRSIWSEPYIKEGAGSTGQGKK